MKLVFNVFTQNLDYVASTPGDVGIVFPLAPNLGGTGIANAAGSTLTLGGATTISGGGTIGLGGFTLTVPATGTAALLAIDQTFTGINRFTLGTDVTNLFLGGAGNTTLTGTENVGLGNTAGDSITTGFGNLCLAANAGTRITEGFNNVCIGKNSGSFITTGGSNTFIGFQTGANITTTNGNVIIGNDVRGTAGDANQLYIHNSSATITLIRGDFLQSFVQFNGRTTTNNAIKTIFKLQAVNTAAGGGGANGFGVGQEFLAETATDGTYQLQGLVSTSWIDAANATRKAKLSLSAYDTAARLGIEIEASGTAAKLGFFGVATVVQPANNVAIDTLLANLGLRASGGESFFDTRLMLPMGEISYFDMTGTNVTIVAQSDGSTNMVKAAPTTTLNNDKEFDNGGANNGRLRYTGATTRTFHVACTISIAPAAANDTFVFGVAKNGTVIAASKVLIQCTTASGVRSTAMHIMVSLATNDYLEMFIGNTTDTDDCTVHSLNLFAMGM